jgi:hypothetical protein
MPDTSKEQAKKRTEMLADLRNQHRERVKQAQALLKEQQTARKALSRSMQGEPKSIPQLAAASGLPAHAVLWHVAAMKKYGEIVEAGMDEDSVYYLYTLAEEARS